MTNKVLQNFKRLFRRLSRAGRLNRRVWVQVKMTYFYHHGADVVAVLAPLDGRRDVIVGVDDADVDVGGRGSLLALYR